MSLYREARSGRRRLWIGATIVAVLIALVIGGLVAREDEPSAAERLASLQEDAQPALAALELIPIHYESTSPTTRAAATDQLGVALTTMAPLYPDLSERDAAGTDRLRQRLGVLAELLRTKAPPEEVERASRDASSELRDLVGLD